MESSENISPGRAAADDFYNEMPALDEPETLPENEDVQVDVEPETEDEKPEPKGEEIATVDELLEHFEVDSDYFESLEIKRKINGEEKTFKLGDILGDSDKFSAGDDYLANAKAKSKAIIAEAEQQKTALGENLVVFGKLLEQVETNLNEDRKNINWADLREKDPAEHAALKQEMRDREDQLKSVKEQAQAAYRQALSQAKARQDAALKASLPEQREVLFKKLPDWGADSNKAETEAREVAKFLQDEGYSDDEMKFVMHNGRDLSVAVKAMRYDRIKDKSKVEEKRVRKVPRILKPGADKGGSKANEKPKDRVDILYG